VVGSDGLRGDHPVNLSQYAVFILSLFVLLLLGDIIEEDRISTLKRVPIEHVHQIIGRMN
jgi:hypothetical protein